ncbi:hypothetical protein C8Q74DRAFT_1277412 [Fomes fomentarius]|nr:hypothetical protein C8Q74DRAFT_1277412 [Fomes fomentarius]
MCPSRDGHSRGLPERGHETHAERSDRGPAFQLWPSTLNRNRDTVSSILCVSWSTLG